MALPKQEAFTGTEANLTSVSGWTANNGTLNRTGSGTGSVSSAGSNQTTLYHWEGDGAFGAAQYAQIKLTAVGSTYQGVALRVPSGSIGGYYFYTNGSASYCGKFNSDGSTDESDSGWGVDKGSFANGDVLRMEVDANFTFTVKKNGTPIGSTFTDPDSSFASGYAGIAAYDSDYPNHTVDDWEGGNVGGGSSVKPGMTVNRGMGRGINRGAVRYPTKR